MDEQDLDGWDPDTTTFEDTLPKGKKNLKPSYTVAQKKTAPSVATHNYAKPQLCSSVVEGLRKATAGNDDQLEIVKARFGAAFPDFFEMTHPSFSDFVKETKHVEFLQEILAALKSGELAPIQRAEND